MLPVEGNCADHRFKIQN